MATATTKTIIFSSCLIATVFFAAAAAPIQKTLTPSALQQTLHSIEQALKEGTSPVIVAEDKRHPFAPLFLGLSLLSGFGATASLTSLLFGNSNPESKSQGIVYLPQLQQLQPQVIPNQASPDLNMGGRNRERAPREGMGNRNLVSTAVKSPLQTQTQSDVSQERGTGNGERKLEQSPAQLPFDQRREWLFQALAESDHNWILQMMEATPLLIWGEQRSGKTQLAYGISLLRKLFMGHDLEVCSPHAHLNQFWHQELPLFGHQYNYSLINRRIAAFYERLKNPKSQKITTIWDEFTRYKDNCNCEQLIKSFISETQKCGEYAIVISHGRTAEFLGGTKGCADAVNQGFVMIQVHGTRDRLGRIVPLGKGTLEGMSKNTKGQNQTRNVEIPQWMTGEYIQQLFPELFFKIPNSTTTENQNIENLNSPPNQNPRRESELFPRRKRLNFNQWSQEYPFPTVEQNEGENRLFPRQKPSSSITSETEKKEEIVKFIQLKKRGLTKEAAILAMWGISKGGSQKWRAKSEQHDSMCQDYREFIEGNRPLDELT